MSKLNTQHTKDHQPFSDATTIDEMERFICPEGTWDAVIYDVDTKRSKSIHFPYLIVFALHVRTFDGEGNEVYFKVWEYIGGLPAMINILMKLKSVYLNKDVKVRIKHSTIPHGIVAKADINWGTLNLDS